MAEAEAKNKVDESSAAKNRAAKVALAAVALLMAMKAVTSVVTGSIGIRADAIHSAIDLLGVVIGFIGIRVSGKPADPDHAFGHDKAENLAGIAVGVLILVAAGLITYEAVRRLVYGGTVELLSVGIYVTIAALAINIGLSRYVLRVARVTESLALEATARDIFADALSSVAVLIGLVLVRATGVAILDPLAALFVALLIARTALRTIKNSFGGLMDATLPETEEEAVRACIMEHYGDKVVGFHELRTRKAGSRRFIEFHLVLPKELNVDEAHSICDHLEVDIAARLQRSNVTIHIEPCMVACDECPRTCNADTDSSKRE